jgi:hypothetical protein
MLTVCVGCDDLLALTLPRNIHHFTDAWVITAPDDEKTIRWCSEFQKQTQRVIHVFKTDAFTRNGAKFNKGLAIEECFEFMGRQGWICILDSDIVLPKKIDWSFAEPGKLYSPPRRMLVDIPKDIDSVEWSRVPVRGDTEFCGYFQLFHASDPVLTKRPWYGTDYIHAGGGDHVFEMKWATRNKIRPNFSVLHLGPADANWFGRATSRIDGQEEPNQAGRRETMHEFLASKGWGVPKVNNGFCEKIAQ